MTYRLRIKWPAPISVTEFPDGEIVGLRKSLILYSSDHSGPRLEPSHCEIDFEVERRARYLTPGQPSLGTRLAALTTNHTFQADVVDGDGAVWWTGVVEDQWEAELERYHFRMRSMASIAKLNFQALSADLTYTSKHVWGTSSTWQQSILYGLLVTSQGLTLEASTETAETPVTALSTAVVHSAAPDGARPWDQLSQMLAASGLTLAPLKDGRSYRVGKIGETRDSTRQADFREHCQDVGISIQRQQVGPRHAVASYVEVLSYRAEAGQGPGNYWEGGGKAGTVLKAGDSWPPGASATNVVQLDFDPAAYEPAPRHPVTEKLLNGARIIACLNPQFVWKDDNISDTALTIMRSTLHATWLDLWAVNNTGADYTWGSQLGLRPHVRPQPDPDHPNTILNIGDVLYASGETQVEVTTIDAHGKGNLDLSDEFLETRAAAQAAGAAIRSWALGRRYRWQIKWTSPDRELMDLSKDLLVSLPDGGSVAVRPIRVTEELQAGRHVVTVTAESGSV